MKKYVIAIFIFVFMSPIVSGQIFEDITAQLCDSLVTANANNPEFVILDVRRPSEYNPEHLAGAINRNYYDNDFSEQLDSLPKHKKYLLHCKSGGRSAGAHDIMFELGFEEVYNMIGGINAWKSGSFPVTDEFAPLLMLLPDTIYGMKEVSIGSIDTIPLTVTNRANALLIFNEICSLDNPEFSTDFDPATTLRGAFDYRFNLFYEPVDEIPDSLSFCIDSQAGSVEIIILRTGVDETSGNQYFANNDMTVFPNPVRDLLNIMSTADQEISLKIMDMQGRTIKQINNFNAKTLDLSSLHPGQYILSVRNESASYNQMLIKL
jgi:rhodanese-related sulfurtransferase